MTVAVTIVLVVLVEFIGAVFAVDLIRRRWPWVVWSGVCFVAASSTLVGHLLGW